MTDPNIRIGTTVRIEFLTDNGSDYHVGDYAGVTHDGESHQVFTRVAGDLKVETVPVESVEALEVV